LSLIALLKRKTKNVLFTTPSHGQKFCIFNKFRQFYKYDISETDTHNPSEALLKAQERAAKIYSVNYTKFLTNGSTSGIIASVLACTKKGDNVLIHKDAHPAHFNAIELAGCNPVFYELPLDSEFGCYTKNSIEIIEPYLKKNSIKAVIITSPTYEGFVSDIKNIKKLCETYGVYLIVDEAHGALYPFSEQLPESAVKIADFTIQSLHKTAGGLNPTALLHSNREDIDIQQALDKITTTSPSYPLLTSIEANINFLNSQNGRKKINQLINQIKELKLSCPEVEFYGDDITKILIKVKDKDGKYYTGTELSDYLFIKGIEDEIVNDKSVMLLCGIGTTEKKLKFLEKVLITLSKKGMNNYDKKLIKCKK